MEQLQGVASHRQYRDDDSQRQGPPESPREVFQLRIFFLFQLRDDRFQRHPADRTVPWSRLADLRVHRTGVFSALTCWSRWLRRSGRLVMPCMRLVAHIVMGTCLEFLQALGTAETIVLPLETQLVRAIGLDLHPTYRIVLTVRVPVRVIGMILIVLAGGAVHTGYVLSSSLEAAELPEWEWLP